jgi:hypothetical protein
MKVANTLAYYDMATITAVKGLKYRLWSLYYKKLYGGNCCRIVISSSIDFQLKSNIRGQG